MSLNVCEQTFYISHLCISQNVKGFLMWHLRHFYSKTKILADFQICISVPLSSILFSPYFGTITENVNLANITNFSYFNLCVFVLLFLFLKFIGVVLLDNPCCMRVGVLSGGLGIEDVNPTNSKNGSAIIHNSHLCD